MNELPSAWLKVESVEYKFNSFKQTVEGTMPIKRKAAKKPASRRAAPKRKTASKAKKRSKK